MNYELYHGDCLDILPTLAPQSVDAVITDPPYGTTACKWDSVIPFEPMWANIKRVLKPRGACVLFGSQPFTSALVMSNPRMFKYTWQWNKRFAGAFATANIRPLSVVEDVIVFYEQQCTYNPQMTMRDVPITSGKRTRPRWSTNTDHPTLYMAEKKTYTHKHPTSIIDIPRNVGEQVLHPTQKPLELMEYLVRTYTHEGDTVLDFTFGSGTTGAACGNLNRNFIGIEKDAAYFSLGRDRIATAYEPLRAMQVAV